MVDRLKSIFALRVCLSVPIASVKLDLDFFIIRDDLYFYHLLSHKFRLCSPEMLWFLNVANIAEMAVPSCFEVAHEHPGELVFGLSVESDDLCAYFEMRDWIIVAA